MLARDWYYNERRRLGLDSAVASIYDRHDDSDLRARAALTMLGVQRGWQVADIGCGNGVLACEAAQMGADIATIPPKVFYQMLQHPLTASGILAARRVPVGILSQATKGRLERSTRYRDVLAISLRGIAAQLGVTVSDAQAEEFGGSVADWPAFPDSGDALQRLRTRFALVTLTNCDNDLFAASQERLGVSFDAIVTAEEVGRYKPDLAGFHLAHERIERELNVPRTRILHVAQSLFHDHVPAKSLGMQTVWIDRRNGRAGGATPPAEATPDARFTSMRAFAEDAVPGY